jgi:hypothetical protein
MESRIKSLFSRAIFGGSRCIGNKTKTGLIFQKNQI